MSLIFKILLKHHVTNGFVLYTYGFEMEIFMSVEG